MARKLKVTSPKTVDGRTIIYDSNKQPIITTSILELGARQHLERMNRTLPAQLRHEFEEVDVEDEVPGIPNAELKQRLAVLENQNEAETLKKRIAELEAKLNVKKENESGQAENTGNETPEKTAAEKVTLINDAKTAAEVDAIVANDDRKTVLNAAEKRKAQL